MRPSTWTETDHRSTLTVNLYRMKVSVRPMLPLGESIKNGTIKLEKVTSIELPRKSEWQGW